MTSTLDPGCVALDVQQVKPAFPRLSFDHNRLDTQLAQRITGCPPGIGFLDSPCQRALSAYRQTPGSRDAGASQQSWGKDKLIMGPQCITGGGDFFKQQSGNQRSPAQLLINNGNRFPSYFTTTLELMLYSLAIL